MTISSALKRQAPSLASDTDLGSAAGATKAPRVGRTIATIIGEKIMWTKPEFTEMRFGFEVTMYIYNR
jgi:pyrroloquinoline quinone biosynthesis protein A